MKPTGPSSSPDLRRRLMASVAASLAVPPLAALMPATALASAWPTRPLRVVVGFTAGSSPDMLARTLAEPLARSLGQAVVVENRPGAGGNLGAEFVARAADGHTLGLLSNGPLTSAQFLFPGLSFGSSSFRPVSLVATAPLAIVAGLAFGAERPQQFFDALKAKGERCNYGSVGIGSAGHLGMELLQSKLRFTATHVPFQGAPQVVTALLAGDVDVAMLPLGPSMPLVRSGRLRGVAVTTSGRSALAPELPPLSGPPTGDLDIEVWNGMFLPASSPPAHAESLSTSLREILQSPEVRQRLFAQGWRAVGTAPEVLRQRIRDDSALYGSMIKARGIRAG
jgi:tripartite-type tricarboxylate transporter receptor subunit TctC